MVLAKTSAPLQYSKSGEAADADSTLLDVGVHPEAQANAVT